MQPPLKDHTSIGDENPTIDFSDSKDMTRQEFKDDADITKLLYRYGVPNRTNPQFGDYDFTLDLQGAMNALTEANDALTRLPQPLRAKYGSLQSLQDGILTGEFEKDYIAHRDALRVEKEDADYAARTAAFERAQERRKETEDREAFELFRKRNRNVTTATNPEELP